MNYFDKIRSLNNLQLCHFLNQIQGELELVSLALDRAANPQIYCSKDNFCTATPDGGKTDRYYSTMCWHHCLSHDFDKDMEGIYENDKEIREQLRGWKDEPDGDSGK